MKLETILIVEDSDLLHRMYDMLLAPLARSGTELVHTFNGREALDQLGSLSQVDLILLDINMPEMSGLEFLRHVRGQRAFDDVPIIIISTEGSEDDTRRGLEAGANAYLTKPFDGHELKALIARVLVHSGELDTESSLTLLGHAGA